MDSLAQGRRSPRRVRNLSRKGDVYRYVATSTVNPEWDAELRELEIFPSRDSVAGRALSERQIVHIDDLTADTEYGHSGFAAIGGARTALGVPLIRDGAAIGVLFLGHDRVQPFTGRQIEHGADLRRSGS